VIERIGRYRIVRKLGEGGMGVVYAAEDERLGRRVALKMVRGALSDSRARQRLWREARAAAAISHPNICQLYEVEEHDDGPYLTMELLEGESLAARIDRGPLPLSAAADTTLQMLTALQALHRRGLIHRDLKPSNVFLTPLGVKLLDFGLARPFDAIEGMGETVASLTGEALVGTPRYLAPELLRGQSADTRADLFAIGAVLYEMLAGRPAFGGTSLPEVLHAISFEHPPVLGGSPGIAAVDRIVHRALAKQPDERYQTAESMADDLRAALRLADSGEIVPARPMTRMIVLPFRTLRSDPDTDFLAFSLPDALTSSLSALESVVVRSSLTASQFADASLDLKRIARDAEVDVALAGTLLRAGSKLRVNAQLVEATGGTVLWSQTSEVPLGDIFALQDDLTQRIVESLSLPLTARDRQVLKHDVPASAKSYEFYLRANQLAYEAKHWTLARDLYLKCLEHDPRYAPAWARLGRIYRVIGLYSGEESADEYFARAQAAFARALELNPHLSLAHNLYTYLEVELGQAKAAMLRLLERANRRSADPELFAGLVQACRYAGLCDASIAAHAHARRLDPGIRTSVAHAYLMLGDYRHAIETDCENPPIVKAMALELLGEREEALAMLRSFEEAALPRLMSLFVVSARTLLEGHREASLEATDELVRRWHLRDPCARYYLARQLARLAEPRALPTLHEVVDGGFCCYTFLTRDPWLDPLRTDPSFRSLLRKSEASYREALTAFLEAGGEHLLGIGGTMTRAVGS
jgi:serine/threonine protein kinase/tetratricopeptide (TPR) repeat protein